MTTTIGPVDTDSAPLLTYRVGGGRFAYRSPDGLRLSYPEATSYLVQRHGMEGIEAQQLLDLTAAEAVKDAGTPRVEWSRPGNRTLYTLDGADPVDRCEASRRLTGEWRMTPAEAAQALDQATARR